MLAEELLRSLEERGEKALRPVFVVVGEESFLIEEVTRALRTAACQGGIAGFNDEAFSAQEASAPSVVAAAKMLPMMGPRRFVLVRNVERWEARDEGGDDKGKGKREAPLDVMAAYAADPNPSTVLVLCASKLHGQRRLMSTAKKQGFLVSCDPLPRFKVPDWAVRRAKSMGHALSSAVAAHLVDMVGHDLGPVAEALERLGLYVGPSRPITEEAVSRMIAPIRAGTVWALTDALCDRNLKKSLLALGEMPLPRGSELMLLGAVTGSIRKLAKLEAALLGGEPLEAAGQRAGIPPFRITQTRDALRRLPPGTLERWLLLVAKAELDLKGGAKRPGRAIVESLVLALCA